MTPDEARTEIGKLQAELARRQAEALAKATDAGNKGGAAVPPPASGRIRPGDWHAGLPAAPAPK